VNIDANTPPIYTIPAGQPTVRVKYSEVDGRRTAALILQRSYSAAGWSAA
jgi:hypothetical protein